MFSFSTVVLSLYHPYSPDSNHNLRSIFLPPLLPPFLSPSYVSLDQSKLSFRFFIKSFSLSSAPSFILPPNAPSLFFPPPSPPLVFLIHPSIKTSSSSVSSLNLTRSFLSLLSIFPLKPPLLRPLLFFFFILLLLFPPPSLLPPYSSLLIPQSR